MGAVLLFGERLLPEVSAIGAQKILKIMNKTHAWDKIATSWNEAASVISKAMKEGIVMPYGTTGLSSKVIQHNGEIVQVVILK
jgi:hypothetical protein